MDTLCISWKYPRYVDILHISWKYPGYVYIIHVLWICPHFVGIIRIVHNTSYLARNVQHGLHSFVLVVDIIYIGHAMNYFAYNFHPIFHIYSSSESYWCITYFPVCNQICFNVPSSFCIVNFVNEYKLNPNPIQIYVPPFITSIKPSFSFLPIFRSACCIGLLYKRVV